MIDLQTIARTIAVSRPAPAPDGARYSSGSDYSPEVPASKPSSGMPIGIIAGIGGVAVLLLILVAGVGFWAMSGNSNGPTPNVAGKTGNASNSGKNTGGNSQRVRIDVDEGKAQVVRDGQVVGTTPLDIDVASGDKPNVTLRRDGYEDKSVQIEPTSGKKVFTYSLKSKN